MRTTLARLLSPSRRVARARLERPVPLVQREPFTPVPSERVEQPVQVDADELALFAAHPDPDVADPYLLMPMHPDVVTL